MNLARGGNTAARLPPYTIDPAGETRIPFCVVSQGIEHSRLIRQQSGKHFVQFENGVCLVEAECFSSSVRAITKTIPDFLLQVLIATEQDVLWCALMGARHDYQYR